MTADVGQEPPKLCPYCRGECFAGYPGEQAGEKSLGRDGLRPGPVRFSAAGTPCHSGPELGSQALTSAPRGALGGTRLGLLSCQCILPSQGL